MVGHQIQLARLKEVSGGVALKDRYLKEGEGMAVGHTALLKRGEAQSGPPNLKWQRGELIQNAKKKKTPTNCILDSSSSFFLIEIQCVKDINIKKMEMRKTQFIILGIVCLLVHNWERESERE